MSQKKYDLEERTYEFAKDVRTLVKQLPSNIINIEDCKQIVRSSGSIAANYIEANEALSKKDFSYRIKISRKESKETILWLKLLKSTNTEFEKNINELIIESDEIKKILSAIYEKSK